MADSSASALILFIAAVAVAAGVAGMLTGTVEDISAAIDVRGDQVTEEVRSDITIISDTGSNAIYDNGTISLYVKNTGNEPLPTSPDSTDIFVDGSYEPVSEIRNPETGNISTQWRPGEVAEIRVNRTLASGQEYRILVHTQGNKDTVAFYNG